jgi:hypothetical protein
MTLARSRSTSLALAAALALAGLVVGSVPSADAGASGPGVASAPIEVADAAGPTHLDPVPPGVRLGTRVPTSVLVGAAAVDQHPARFAGRQQSLSFGTTSPSEVLVTPGGRPGLRGLVEHVAPSCSGTGTDGNRVQVIYASQADQVDRYGELLASLQSYVADVDDTFALSSRESGRRVRWVSDSSCSPVIDHVIGPSGTLSRPDMAGLKTSLQVLGYDSPQRKYLVLADAAELCGVADVYVDDRPSSANRNNGVAPMYARVDTPCWAVSRSGHSTPAHELMHMLGAVQPSAPHGTATGHCTDERDAMCYADGDGQAMRRVCTQPDDEQLFDCGRDDYFDPSPEPQSEYLRQHWNTADSSFLDRISLARNAIGLPAVASIAGPTRLRPGLPATLTVGADRPVRTVWTASKKSCLEAWTTGARVRVQCPTTTAGSVTLMATVTAEDGTVARVNRRIVLSGSPASMAVDVVSPSEVVVGGAAPLRARVTYRDRAVLAAVSLQQYAGRTRGWVTIDTATTGADGLAEFSVRRDTVGVRTYRVQVRTADGSGWVTSRSSSVQVDVVPVAPSAAVEP